jgi:hypothetical protein
MPYAKAMVDIALRAGLKFDTAPSRDVTRVLRIPDTKNYKNKPPTDVTIEYDGGYDYSLEELNPFLTGSSQEDGEDEKNMGRGTATRNYPPADIELVRKECGFVDHMLTTGGPEYNENIWHACASLSCHCTNPEETMVKLTIKNPNCNVYSTEQKLKEAQHARQLYPTIGPHKCEAIQKLGVTQCATCKHKDKGTTPLTFGRAINGQFYFNDLPKGYKRGTDDKIYAEVADENGKTWCVFTHPIVVNSGQVKSGNPYVLYFDTLVGNKQETITVTGGQITDKNTLSKVLGDQGCGIVPNDKTRIFFLAWMDKLKNDAKTLISIPPIGWHTNGNETGFAFNGQFVSATQQLPCQLLGGFKYGVVGDIKVWNELAHIVITPDRPDLSCLVAAGFASPLVEFTGHNGYLIGGWSPESGRGKTTALSLAQSIWGSPKEMNGLNDTAYHIFGKVAMLQSIAVIHDEIKTPQQVAQFLTTITQLTSGRDKGRANRDGTPRAPKEWKNEIIYAANQSIVKAAEIRSGGTYAEILRMYEYPCLDMPKTHSVAEVSGITAELEYNYGHVGQAYARYLGERRNDIKDFIKQLQSRYEKHLQFNADERFWLAAFTSIIAAGKLASQFAPFDIPSMEKFLIQQLERMRTERMNSPGDYSNFDIVRSELNHFIRDYWATKLVRTDVILTEKGRPKLGGIKVLNEYPTKVWNGVEVQLGENPLKIRFAASTFNQWCKRNDKNSGNLGEAIKKKFPAIIGNARIASGCGPKYCSGNTELCWTIDLTIMEDDIVEIKKDDIVEINEEMKDEPQTDTST